MKTLALTLALALMMFSLPLMAEEAQLTDTNKSMELTDVQRDLMHKLRVDFTVITRNSQPSEEQIGTIKDDIIAMFDRKNENIEELAGKLATAIAQSRANGKLNNRQKSRTANHIFIITNSNKYDSNTVQNAIQGLEGDVTASGNSPEQASAVVSALKDIVDFNSKPITSNSKIQELKEELLKGENEALNETPITEKQNLEATEAAPVEQEKVEPVKKAVKKPVKKPVKKAVKKVVKKVPVSKPVEQPKTEAPVTTETAPVTPAVETPVAPATETPATETPTSTQTETQPATTPATGSGN